MTNIVEREYKFFTDPYAKTYPETYNFWIAAEDGKLLLKNCSDCIQPHWYPRILCPHCGSLNTNWIQACGKGTIYTYSINKKATPPYILAYVKLEEGPIIMTNIIDCEENLLSIGAPVEVIFQQVSNGRSMPFFRII